MNIFELAMLRNKKGVSSWNDLTDKPFGEETGFVEKIPEITLPLENGEGVIPMYVPELIDGAIYTVTINGTVYNTKGVVIPAEGGSMGGLGNLSMIGMKETGEPFAILLQTKAGYEVNGYGGFFLSLDSTINEVTIRVTGNETVIKKLDNKYIDAEWIANTSPKIILEKTFDEDEAEYNENIGYYSVSIIGNIINELYVGKKIIITYNRDFSMECTVKGNTLNEYPEAVFVVGNKALINSTYEYTEEPFLVILSAGTVTFISPLEPTSLRIVDINNKIPLKYLPESVEGVVLRSSTADSTKLFKITVDDTGVITATEVTA